MSKTVRYFKMKWNKYKELWYLRTEKKGKHPFIQEFFDCENVDLSFPSLDKQKENHYKVEITKENQMSGLEKAEDGRLTSKYTIEVINDKGIVTIDGVVTIRDLSLSDASLQLKSTLEALFAPAKANGQL